MIAVLGWRLGVERRRHRMRRSRPGHGSPVPEFVVPGEGRGPDLSPLIHAKTSWRRAAVEAWAASGIGGQAA